MLVPTNRSRRRLTSCRSPGCPTPTAQKPNGAIDEVAFYVLPYMRGPAVLERAAEMPKLQVVQTLTAGYEEFLSLVPPAVTLCNAAGLHDTSTAELAIALALASGRHLDEFARNQAEGEWKFVFGRALADQRALIVGGARTRAGTIMDAGTDKTDRGGG
jgi:phosphoglycerate dehydrogenase-like enzyme